MNAVTFDTLKFTRKLKEAGFTAKQAQGVADAFTEAASDELATKHDLRALELRILKWMIPLMLSQTALTVTLTVALVKLL